MLNEDYKDILRILLKNEVRFLVVGAYAMGVYGYVRATGDMDIWVEASPENAIKVYNSVVEFGAPVSDVSPEDFAQDSIVFQIGVYPRRIDILTSIDGVDFVEAYQNRNVVEIDGLPIPFISKTHLIKNKSASGRDKDKVDLRYLTGEEGD